MPESAAHFTAQAKAADPKVVQELERGSGRRNGAVGQAAPIAPDHAAAAVAPERAADATAPGAAASAAAPPANPVAGPGGLLTLSAEALLSDAPVAHVSEALEAGTRTPLPSAFLEGRTAATMTSAANP